MLRNITLLKNSSFLEVEKVGDLLAHFERIRKEIREKLLQKKSGKNANSILSIDVGLDEVMPEIDNEMSELINGLNQSELDDLLCRAEIGYAFYNAYLSELETQNTKYEKLNTNGQHNDILAALKLDIKQVQEKITVPNSIKNLVAKRLLELAGINTPTVLDINKILDPVEAKYTDFKSHFSKNRKNLVNILTFKIITIEFNERLSRLKEKMGKNVNDNSYVVQMLTNLEDIRTDDAMYSTEKEKLDAMKKEIAETSLLLRLPSSSLCYFGGSSNNNIAYHLEQFLLQEFNVSKNDIVKIGREEIEEQLEQEKAFAGKLKFSEEVESLKIRK